MSDDNLEIQVFGMAQIEPGGDYFGIASEFGKEPESYDIMVSRNLTSGEIEAIEEIDDLTWNSAIQLIAVLEEKYGVLCEWVL